MTEPRGASVGTPKKLGKPQGPSACESALRKMRIVVQAASFAALSKDASADVEG